MASQPQGGPQQPRRSLAMHQKVLQKWIIGLFEGQAEFHVTKTE